MALLSEEEVFASATVAAVKPKRYLTDEEVFGATDRATPDSAETAPLSDEEVFTAPTTPAKTSTPAKKQTYKPFLSSVSGILNPLLDAAAAVTGGLTRKPPQEGSESRGGYAESGVRAVTRGTVLGLPDVVGGAAELFGTNLSEPVATVDQEVAGRLRRLEKTGAPFRTPGAPDEPGLPATGLERAERDYGLKPRASMTPEDRSREEIEVREDVERKRGLYKGFRDSVRAIGRAGFIDKLTDKELDQHVSGLLKRTGAGLQNFSATAQENLPGLQPDLAFQKRTTYENLKHDLPMALLVYGGENAPNFAASALAYYLFGPGGAALTSVSLEAGDSWKEGKNHFIKKYGGLDKVPPEEWALLADTSNVVGVSAGTFDILPIISIFKKANLDKVFTKNMTRAAAAYATAKHATKRGLKSAAFEMGTEDIQELIQIAGQETIGQNFTLSEKFNRLLQAAVAAGPVGFSGGFASGLSDTAGYESPHPQGDIVPPARRPEEVVGQPPTGQPLSSAIEADIQGKPAPITDQQVAGFEDVSDLPPDVVTGAAPAPSDIDQPAQPIQPPAGPLTRAVATVLKAPADRVATGEDSGSTATIDVTQPGETRRRAPAAAAVLDPSRDDLLAAIAKSGGLSRAEAEAQGIDPAAFRTRGWRIKPVFTKGGISFDAMAELLDQHEYPVRDEGGGYSPNKLLALLSDALAGKKVFTATGTEAAAEGSLDDLDTRLATEYDDLSAIADAGGLTEPLSVDLATARKRAEAAIGADAVEGLLERVSIEHSSSSDAEYERAVLNLLEAIPNERQVSDDAGDDAGIQGRGTGQRPGQSAEGRETDAGQGRAGIDPAGQEVAAPTPPEGGVSVSAEQRLAARPKPAEQGDLFGGDRQAIHDANLRVKERLSGEPVPVEAGAGDLFSGKSKQTDIADIAPSDTTETADTSASLLADVSLANITVRVRAVEAGTGRKVSYAEKADVALKDVNDRISKAREILECLAS